jgi:NitT/TauT family transport system substrate-binding protein
MQRRTALATFALATFSATKAARAQTAPEKLLVAGPPTEDVVNLYYAVKTGMFKKVGLDVEMISTSSGTAATTATLTGTYDIARTSVMPVFTAYLRGIAVAVVAPDGLFSSRSPYGLLQVATDSTIRTGADLNGKTVSTAALNDLVTLAIRSWVDKNGGDWRSLKFIEIPNSAVEAALVQHRIDAGLLLSPQLDASLAAGTTKTLGDALGAIAPSFCSGVYIARREWATAHIDALRRYNRVLSEASAYVNGHHPETTGLVAELTKIELANAAKMHRTINATSLDLNLVQPVIDAAVKFEQIPRWFSARDIFST